MTPASKGPGEGVIVRTTALSRFLSARPRAHAWNDARNNLYHNGVDDLFFGPWNPTCTA